MGMNGYWSGWNLVDIFGGWRWINETWWHDNSWGKTYNSRRYQLTTQPSYGSYGISPLLIDKWSNQLDHSVRSRLFNGGFKQNIWFWVGLIDITIENCQQKGITIQQNRGVSPAKMWHFIQNQQQRGTCTFSSRMVVSLWTSMFFVFLQQSGGYGYESKPWHSTMK